MAIDNCLHTFQQLSATELPILKQTLDGLMRSAHNASDFAIVGHGVKTILKRLNMPKDIPGLYIFVEEGKPLYVGISRNVIQRLRQHLTGGTHFDASLAYMMAEVAAGTGKKRSDHMEDPDFLEAFDKAQDRLKRCKVAFIEISDAVTRYLFEVYAAMQYDTKEWNHFETH